MTNDRKTAPEGAKPENVYCPSCRHPVRITVGRGHRDGHANLPDAGEVVCMDFGGACGEGTCPLTGRPGMVMGVRLAKSHLNDAAFQTIHGECASCHAMVALEMLDRDHAICPECETTNRYVFVDFEDGSAVAITEV